MPRYTLVTIALILSLAACSGAAVVASSEPQLLSVNRVESATQAPPQQVLRVSSLNIAHGRGESFNQLLVSKDRIRDNLERIAGFLRDKEIHIAALQEVDAPSSWSGRFDHADFIANDAGYPYWIQASHASVGLADYGTAILSSAPITAAAQQDFTPSPPTAGKGFTIAEIIWEGAPESPLVIDVVSIHMDFSRKSVRQKQTEELDAVLRNRDNPLIIMGDFNSESLAYELVRNAAENERLLHTWIEADNPHYSYKKKRLDWIIVSGEFEFIDYRTETDVLSDHRAVVAELRLRP
jgi:endonuclease/exonuclease/phosphatase family metal-dependent hydrolase